MNCLDCTLAGATTPAVATCHSCGAAVCADHAVIQPHHLQRVVPLNRLIPVDPPARIIACTICAAAQHAAEHPEPASRHHLFRRRHTASQPAHLATPAPQDLHEVSSASGPTDRTMAAPQHR